MNLGEVIKKADTLYPNRYSINEKLDWCYEVSTHIRTSLDKQYINVYSHSSRLRFTVDTIGYKHIEALYCGDVKVPKSDIRSWYEEYTKLPKSIEGDIKVVYLSRPLRYNYETYLGYATCKDGSIRLVENVYFRTGDTISIKYDGKSIECVITGGSQHNYTVKGLYDTYEGELEIKTVLNNQLECDAPYDNLYLDFLLGKICYYQSDYDGYNQHMTQYNNKLTLYEKWLKMNRTYKNTANFNGLWR